MVREVELERICKGVNDSIPQFLFSDGVHDAKPAVSVCACACMLVINKVLHAQNKALKAGLVNVATEQLQWPQKPEELDVNASLF